MSLDLLSDLQKVKFPEKKLLFFLAIINMVYIITCIFAS